MICALNGTQKLKKVKFMPNPVKKVLKRRAPQQIQPNVILRRRKLGLTSAREIAKGMNAPTMQRLHEKGVPEGNGHLFRWGCTAQVPNGYKIYNTAAAISLVNNKTEFRRKLSAENLCTKTWESMADLENEVENPGQVIVRPQKHAQGRNLYLCTTRDELIDATNKCGEGYYINKFVNKVAEYRVFVANGRVVWVAQKTPGNPDDIAWNVSQGGRFDNVNFDAWPLKVVKSAIAAHGLSGLDFSGVDVMVDDGDNAWVLEINSAPSQTSPYRQSCVAKVFDYMIENGKDVIPTIEDRGGYRKFIHPAVSDRAILVG